MRSDWAWQYVGWARDARLRGDLPEARYYLARAADERRYAVRLRGFKRDADLAAALLNGRG